jgi:hypothetical protein
VAFHLARLGTAISPSPEQAASRRRRVNNRRLAHMRVLDQAGYFLEAGAYTRSLQSST